MLREPEDHNGPFYGDRLEPIAIVGAACRLPGDATSLPKLWDMISTGKQAHSKVPLDRFDADACYHPDPDRKGTISTTHGFFLKEDISVWDAPFFGITANEAAGMDPMKRLLLEVSYECFESAGIPIETLANSQTGCYVGCMTHDYELLSARDTDNSAYVAAVGNSQAMIANRLSWYFGMRGPSLTLDTACSSSLYAFHLACQSLRLGETSMGLVAGVNLLLFPTYYAQLSAMHMLSPDGISHSFDDRANGYGRGEGIGAVVIKRLSDALRDGDTIRAVIRGTGANVDGKTPSITMPSSEAQAELIQRTYETAGLSFDDTGYFECHGTGTPVGDPIELKGIASTIAARRTAKNPLHVGSVKPSVGHTEGCSGLAGLFKALHCMEQGILVPTAGFEKLNPALKLDEWHLALPAQNMPWPSAGLRRASVASFGFGGSNAHVIMDDAYHYLKERRLIGNHTTVVDDESDAAQPDDGSDSGVSLGPDSRFKMFALSAKNQTSLTKVAAALQEHLQAQSPDLDDLAYTLAHRRTLHDFRAFAVSDSLKNLGSQLIKLAKTQRIIKHQNIAFVFTGQGAQWKSMGIDLLKLPVFERSIATSQQWLSDLGCKWDIVDELDGPGLDKPQYSQPLCTAVQIALVDLLASWNIHPRATVGHSSGEIAAAYAAKLISHKDAICIAYCRGICSASITRKGAMLAVGMSEEDVKNHLIDGAVVACVNSPVSITLSGDEDAITKLEESLTKDGHFARRLRVQTAYHSPHMLDVEHMYADLLADIDPLENSGIPFFSSVTGKQATAADVGPSYWVQNMCGQVKFSQALTSLLSHTAETGPRKRKAAIKWSAILEVGPHAALQGPIKQILHGGKSSELQYASVLQRARNGQESAMQAAGTLWQNGHDVDFEAVNGGYGDIRKALPDLPAYPWDHSKNYWHEPRSARSLRYPGPRSDFLGIAVENQNALAPCWRNRLRVAENPWIEHHAVTGTILYPGAGMLIMVIEAACQMANARAVEFHDVRFERGLVFTSPEEAVEVSLSVQPDEEAYRFVVHSQPSDGTWTRHCSGRFSIVPQDSPMTKPIAKVASIQSLVEQSPVRFDVQQMYKRLEEVGMQYGELFRNVAEAVTLPGRSECYGTVKVPDTKTHMPFEFEYPHVIHPATLDAIFHLLFVAFSGQEEMTEAAVPYSLEYMYINTNLPKGENVAFKGRAQRADTYGGEAAGDIVAAAVTGEMDSTSTPLDADLIIRNFRMRQVTSSQELSIDNSHLDRCSTIAWMLEPTHAAYSAVSLHSWLASYCDVSRDSKTLLLTSADETSEILRDFGPEVESAARLGSYKSINVDGVHTPVSQLFGEGRFESDLLITSASTQATDLRQALDHHIPHTLVAAEPADELISVISSSMRVVASTPNMLVAKPKPMAIEVMYILLPDDVSEELQLLVDLLQDHFKTQDTVIETMTLTDSKKVAGCHIISLLEAEQPFTIHFTSEDFELIKPLLTAKQVLWISRGAQGTSIDFAPSTGFLRVIRNEYSQLRLTHLDISKDSKLSSLQTSVIDLCMSGDEEEFAERDGCLYVPRLQHAPAINQELKQRSGKANVMMGRLSGSMEMVSGVFKDMTALEIADDEVEVRIETVTLDDVREATGVITRIGERADLQVGAKVSLLYSGNIKTHVRIRQDLVVPQRSELKNTTMAWYALGSSRLVEGQKLFVHSTNASVVRATVEAGKHIGAEVFTSLPEFDVPVVEEGADFINRLLSQTQGVDVILTDNPSASLVRALPDFGSLIVLGNKAVRFDRPNIQVTTIDFDALLKQRPGLVARALQACSKLSSPPSPILIPIGRLSKHNPAIRSYWTTL